MAGKQNKFYSSISNYYPEIFPYNPAQLQFVSKKSGGLDGKKVLDIGCATGELAFQLTKSGAFVTGIDLNEDLLDKAKTSKTHPNLNFQKGDMLQLENDFGPVVFDVVLCLGNTLVHLPTAELIFEMLQGVHAVLKPGGVFLLQILNYDYILSEQVTELPLIESENIKFIRRYVFTENSPLISFQTELFIKKEGEIIFNETPLLTLKSNELKKLLKKAGFEKVELFANFNEAPSGGNHLPLVLKAEKPS